MHRRPRLGIGVEDAPAELRDIDPRTDDRSLRFEVHAVDLDGLVDHFVDPDGILVDHVERVSHLLVGDLLAQLAHRAEDHRKRGFQFVRDVGQELHLVADAGQRMVAFALFEAPAVPAAQQDDRRERRAAQHEEVGADGVPARIPRSLDLDLQRNGDRSGRIMPDEQFIRAGRQVRNGQRVLPRRQHDVIVRNPGNMVCVAIALYGVAVERAQFDFHLVGRGFECNARQPAPCGEGGSGDLPVDEHPHDVHALFPDVVDDPFGVDLDDLVGASQQDAAVRGVEVDGGVRPAGKGQKIDFARDGVQRPDARRCHDPQLGADLFQIDDVVASRFSGREPVHAGLRHLR